MINKYFLILRHRWVTAVSVAAISWVIAVVIFVALPRLYESSSTSYVGVPTGSADNTTFQYQAGLLSQERVASYVQLATSDQVLSSVKRALSLQDSVSSLRGDVEVAAAPDTVLLTVTVTRRSPSEAAAIADQISSDLGVLVQQLETPPGGTSGPAVYVRQVGKAPTSTSPVSPSPLRVLGGGLALGLLLALAAGVAREMSERTVQSVKEVQELSGVPLLGSVPREQRVDEAGLWNLRDGSFASAENFRSMRTKLPFLVDPSKPTIYAVVSAVPGEGKSDFTCRFASTLAKGGRAVLVIDADLRRPSIAKYSGCEDRAGLSDVLAGRIDVHAAIQRRHHQFGVDFLTGGNRAPNPNELLSSGQLDAIFRDLRKQYDSIIVDTAPLLPVSDALPIVPLVQLVVLISAIGTCRKEDLTSAVRRLEEAGVMKKVTVANFAPVRKVDKYSYYQAPDLVNVVSTPRTREQLTRASIES